jgi:hypothetical protein
MLNVIIFVVNKSENAGLTQLKYSNQKFRCLATAVIIYYFIIVNKKGIIIM